MYFTSNSIRPVKSCGKHKGFSSLLLGCYILLALFILGAIAYEKYRLDYTVEYVEDGITASALGGLYVDSAHYSITKETYIKPYEGTADDYSDTVGRIITLFTDNMMASALFNGTPTVTEVTIYNADKSGNITSYPYRRSGSVMLPVNDKTEKKTKSGITVKNTSIYVEAEIPIKLFGKDKQFKKGVLVAVEDTSK